MLPGETARATQKSQFPKDLRRTLTRSHTTFLSKSDSGVAAGADPPVSRRPDAGGGSLEELSLRTRAGVGVVGVLAVGGDALACGDKLVVVGRGLKTNRAMGPHTGPPSSCTRTRRARCRRPSRRGTSGRTSSGRGTVSERPRARRSSTRPSGPAPTTWCSADFKAAPGLESEASSAASKPTVLPTLFNPTDAELAAASRQYTCVVKAPGDQKDYMTVINEAMAERAKQTSTQEQVDAQAARRSERRNAMRRSRVSALVASVGLATLAARAAQAQAWTPPKGEASVTIGYAQPRRPAPRRSGQRPDRSLGQRQLGQHDLERGRHGPGLWHHRPAGRARGPALRGLEVRRGFPHPPLPATRTRTTEAGTPRSGTSVPRFVSRRPAGRWS